jgi:hypothetical protein
VCSAKYKPRIAHETRCSASAARFSAAFVLAAISSIAVTTVVNKASRSADGTCDVISTTPPPRGDRSHDQAGRSQRDPRVGWIRGGAHDLDECRKRETWKRLRPVTASTTRAASPTFPIPRSPSTKARNMRTMDQGSKGAIKCGRLSCRTFAANAVRLHLHSRPCRQSVLRETPERRRNSTEFRSHLGKSRSSVIST